MSPSAETRVAEARTRPDRPGPPFWLIALLLVSASLLYCLPLFRHFDYWGRQDWDQFIFRYETPRLAILRDHVFPAWNPYAAGGTALIAHPDSPALSPWYLLVLIAGAPLGLRIQVVLFMAIGAVGMAALALRLGANRFGAVVGGIVFMMSAHYALHIAEGHLEWCVLGLMPWLALWLLKAERDRRYLIGAVALLASVLLFGAVYIPAVFLPFFSTWFLLRTLRDRSWRPLIHWVTVATIAGLLSAVKLVPTMRFASVGVRELTVEQRTRPGVLLAGLLDPRQAGLYQAHRDRDVPDGHFGKAIDSRESRPLVEYLGRLGVDTRFHEYGSYIGAVGLLLAAFGLFRGWKRLWPLFGAGALATLTVLGTSSPIDLWAALRQLPLYGQLQVPSRFLAATVFVLSIAAAFGLAALLDVLRGPVRRFGRALAATLIVLLYGELLVLGWSLFRDVFVVPPVTFPAHAEFAQRFRERFAPGTAEADYALVMASDMYGHMLGNSGTLDAYENLTVPPGDVRTPADPGYRGEVYLQHGHGRADVRSWTMSRIHARVDATAPDSIVLNQNYSIGWMARHTDRRGEERTGPAIATTGGLVSTTVGPDDADIELFYRPPGLVLGATVSGLTLVLALLWLALVYGREARYLLPRS